MAENKKSVLLYCDIYHTVKNLTDEEAGKLWKHYLSYVNDENPASDRFTELLFEPIKQQLKRDLKKWEDIIDNRSKAGLASAEKRKQNQHMSTHVESVQQGSTNSTVKVNVKVKEINIPDQFEFLEFCKTIKEIDFKQYEFSLKSKYESWIENGWKDGNENKIKNWKSKIKNTIPFLKPEQKRHISNHDTDGIL